MMSKLAARKSVRKAPELENFDAWGERLRRTYLKAEKREKKREGELRPRKRAINRFKLEAYAYSIQLVKAKLIPPLRAFVEARDGNQWAGHGDSPELWVLRLVTRDEQDDTRRARRSRLAAELRLARINQVEPELLLGFLYEAGPIALIKKDARADKTYTWAAAYQ
ncbi:MAG: hypothetical protein ABJF09_08860 [Qipengyuania citrea]|uniref:hypothetical protein n=2 Tax=Alphaproteobacteria TaxID=28211 RepID=UPI0032650F3D